MTRQDQIELLCTYLAASEVRDAHWVGLSSGWERVLGGVVRPPSLAEFDLVEPLWGIDDVDDDSLDEAAFPSNMPLRPGQDLSVAHEVIGTGEVALTRVRCLTPREARGKVRYARHMVKQWRAILDKAGNCVDGYSGLYVVSNDGRHWTSAAGPLSAASTKEQTAAIHLVPGILWARARTWRVAIGFEDSPRIDLDTSPAGVRELFALRDVPNGAKRRAALRHWVTGHWRKRHAEEDAAAMSWVRSHLRGATEFTWNGMRGRISVPSPEAEAERDAAIKALKAMQAERATRAAAGANP